MSTIGRCVAAVLVCGVMLPGPVTAQAVGHGFDLGGFRAYPWLNWLLSYETNYYRSNDRLAAAGLLGPMGTFVSIVEPGIRLTALRGPNSYNLTYFARIGNVLSSSADDFVDQQASAAANWDLGLRHRASAEYAFWYWHDPRGSGSPSDASRANFKDAPDLWNSNRVKLGYSYGALGAPGRLDLSAGFLTRHYLNNGQEVRDNDRTLLGATFFARIRPKISLLFELGWEDIDYVRESPRALTLDSAQMVVYGGATWDATAKTSGTVKVGWLSKDFVAPARQDISDFGWSANVQWRPLTYSTVNLTTARAPEESTTGLADAVIVSSVNLDWVHYWKDRLHTRCGLLATTDDYVGEPRVDHRYNLSGGVFYQLRSWLELGLDYTYETRTSNEPLADYTNNVYLFSVRTAY